MSDPIVHAWPMQGEGAHTFAVLTKSGKMFERIPDPRAFNNDGRSQRQYLWREIKGPDAGE